MNELEKPLCFKWSGVLGNWDKNELNIHILYIIFWGEVNTFLEMLELLV